MLKILVFFIFQALQILLHFQYTYTNSMRHNSMKTTVIKTTVFWYGNTLEEIQH